jgi:hypothetical protein
VKAWTLANWARWEGEEWFDARVKERVPDEYIPVAELEELNAAAREGSRKRVGLARVSLKRLTLVTARGSSVSGGGAAAARGADAQAQGQRVGER